MSQLAQTVIDHDRRPPLAWQPLTLGGVALFAQARFGRLFFVGTAVALVVAAAMVFFFLHAWAPALAHGISQLPQGAEIARGRLVWPNAAPTRLVNSAFLSIAIDPSGDAEMGDAADLQCEFNQTSLRFRSLFGYLKIPYPANGRISLSRSDVEPWWGAWLPVIIAAIVVFTVLALWISWSVLAMIYAVFVAGIAFYTDRSLTFVGSWKLGVASSMPGAVAMSLAIVAYTFGQITLLQFLSLWLLHFAVAWVYVVFAPLRVPRLPVSDRLLGQRNPFREARPQ